MNINVPKNISWILLVAISVPLSLMYGSGDNPKGVKIVENAMKILIGIMLVVFGAVLCVTGVDFKAMIKGLLIPTLPSGIDGIVMLIASLTATSASWTGYCSTTVWNPADILKTMRLWAALTPCSAD